MATSRSWRRTLLGSLQGQLQLATYLAVFIGFTGASSAGLWIGQRNLIQNDLRELRDSADSIQQCLRKGGGDDASVRQELLLHSGMRTSLWIEQPDGSLLLPESDHVSISDQTIRAAMAIAVATIAPTPETAVAVTRTMLASSTSPRLQNSRATNARLMTPGE